MSIEPEALDRSVLESKGRDELQAIAAAIGAKPGSRARKAQIVDSILAAAGIDPSAPSEPTPAPVESPPPAAAPPSAPRRPAATARSGSASG
ncbi:MAG: hypothetical protein AAGF02_16285, partial [Actinomycetota bacterium]